jgi:haloacetate dehalogenase
MDSIMTKQTRNNPAVRQQNIGRRRLLALAAGAGVLSASVANAADDQTEHVRTSMSNATMPMEGIKRLLPGFAISRIATSGAVINTAVGGEGPALLLLHGHPQTMVCWHKIAPELAKTFTVVLCDLRGYGDSSKPEGGEDHAAYSKREMAKDLVEVMKSLGHDRFQVAAHDRGARVLHRMLLDYPQAITRAAVLDIAPTATMYAHVTKQFATQYMWWFFLIQPAPLPETLIGNNLDFYLETHVKKQNKTPGAVSPEAMAEYRRCYTKETLHAVCEDYRASASIDLEHDAADAATKIEIPLLALWGEKGVVGRTYDVLAAWREKARDVTGGALPCGHYLPEESPEQLLAALVPFFSIA